MAASPMKLSKVSGLSCGTQPIGVAITKTREVDTPGASSYWEYGVECYSRRGRAELLACTWHRYSGFVQLHEALVAEAERLELVAVLPSLPQTAGFGLTRADPEERKLKLAEYLRVLLPIAARDMSFQQAGGIAMARCVTEHLDGFLGLASLVEEDMLGFGGSGKSPWEYIRGLHAAALMIQAAWRLHTQQLQTRQQLSAAAIAQKLNAAKMYTAKLQFCEDEQQRVVLLSSRAECWLAEGVDEFEKAHADCNEALELDPAHARCKQQRQRAETGIFLHLTVALAPPPPPSPEVPSTPELKVRELKSAISSELHSPTPLEIEALIQAQMAAVGISPSSGLMHSPRALMLSPPKAAAAAEDGEDENWQMLAAQQAIDAVIGPSERVLDLQEQQRQFEEELAAKQDELAAKELEVEAVRAELDDLTSESAVASASAAETKRELERRLSESEAAGASLAVEVVELEEGLAVASAEVESKRAQLQVAVAEMEQHAAMVDQTTQQLAAAQSEVCAKCLEVASVRAELGALASTSESELATRAAEIVQLDQRLFASQASSEVKTQELLQAESAFVTATAELRREQAEMAAEALTVLRAKEAELAELEGALAASKQPEDEFRSEQDALEQQMNTQLSAKVRFSDPTCWCLWCLLCASPSVSFWLT